MHNYRLSGKIKGSVIINKSKIIYELWKLLDDIDTASDVFKENYHHLANYVYEQQRKRFNFISGKQIDKLYDKYEKYSNLDIVDNLEPLDILNIDTCTIDKVNITENGIKVTQGWYIGYRENNRKINKWKWWYTILEESSLEEDIINGGNTINSCELKTFNIKVQGHIVKD